MIYGKQVNQNEDVKQGCLRILHNNCNIDAMFLRMHIFNQVNRQSKNIWMPKCVFEVATECIFDEHYAHVTILAKNNIFCFDNKTIIYVQD